MAEKEAIRRVRKAWGLSVEEDDAFVALEEVGEKIFAWERASSVVIESPTTVLSSVKALMATHKPPLQALMIPGDHLHQSLYVSLDRDKRMRNVTEFTGCGGFALVTQAAAYLWVNAGDIQQALHEVNQDYWTVAEFKNMALLCKSITKLLPEGSSIGVDMTCLFVESKNHFSTEFAARNLQLIATDGNLGDIAWNTRAPYL